MNGGKVGLVSDLLVFQRLFFVLEGWMNGRKGRKVA